MRITTVLALPLILLASVSLAQPLEPSTRKLEFGTVVGDESAERVVSVANPGTEPVRIRNVQLTPPLVVARMKAVVEPGQTAEIVVRLGSPRPTGDYTGLVAVNFENGGSLDLDVSANLVPPIEFVPRAELVAVTERGVEARDALEIVSHLKEPLQVTGGQASNERFSTALETLEAGRRYRLSLLLSGRGAGGKQVDTVTLATSSPDQPVLNVRVRTLVKERVYTFPDRIDFGRIALASTGADNVGLFDTSVMVYQKDGRDFQIKVSTDVPFLVVRAEKSAMFGDRWQIFCSIDPKRLGAGRVSGSLTIETNDREFPKLTVPVEAVVE